MALERQRHAGSDERQEDRGTYGEKLEIASLVSASSTATFDETTFLQHFSFGHAKNSTVPQFLRICLSIRARSFRWHEFQYI